MNKYNNPNHAIDQPQSSLGNISLAEKERLINMLDMLPGYVCFQAPDHSIPLVNKKFKQLFGEPADRPCYQIFRGRTEPCKDCPTFRAFKTRQETWEWDSPNGRSYMIYDNLFIDHDNAPFILEIGLDITDRKMAEDEIRSKEEQFRTIADFTYDWEYWLQSDGSLSYNSPSCLRITGRKADDYINDPDLLVKIAHPDDQARIHQHLKEAAISEQVYALDYRIIDDNGDERWIGHACQPVYNTSGIHIGRRASNRDITESKKAEKALLQAERLAAMGRLIASLAHEINNPLQAISNSLELAIDFPLNDDERQHYLNGARQEVERLVQITHDILAYTRPHEIKHSLADIEQVIQHTLQLAKDKLDRYQIETHLQISEHLPQVPMPDEQLGQVCLNLVTNAIDQMRNGGSLTISAVHQGENMIISFQDTGSGIPEFKKDYLFEPFYTTKTDGTGLGLSISQNIIKTYQGKITAENIKGGGAVFKVILPLMLSI